MPHLFTRCLPTIICVMLMLTVFYFVIFCLFFYFCYMLHFFMTPIWRGLCFVFPFVIVLYISSMNTKLKKIGKLVKVVCLVEFPCIHMFQI